MVPSADVSLHTLRCALIQQFLADEGLDGLFLQRADNLAMATGGCRNYVNRHSTTGAFGLFVPASGPALFVGDAIESTRAMDEELGALGCDAIVYPWFEGGAIPALRSRFHGTLAADTDGLDRNVHDALQPLRSLMLGAELDKYRVLGRLAAEAMTEAARSVRRGKHEIEIDALIEGAGARRGCNVPVSLVATDDRIARYRHPLPGVARVLDANPLGGPRLERYVMLVGCFEREGLVASMTRFAAVDSLPPAIEDALPRIARVDAAMQRATHPDATLGEVFAAAQEAYVDAGFAPDEWHRHHQGGLTGYGPRTAKAFPASPVPVLAHTWAQRARALAGETLPHGAAVAWNPSAPGVKSEDTFLQFADGRQEMVTATKDLPTQEVGAPADRDTPILKAGVLRNA